MSDDILAVHVWGRNTQLAGQKWDGDPAQLSALKDAGLVLSYHGTAAELQALSGNCNLQRRGPEARFNAALSATLKQAAEEAAAPIVVPMTDEDDKTEGE